MGSSSAPKTLHLAIPSWEVLRINLETPLGGPPDLIIKFWDLTGKKRKRKLESFPSAKGASLVASFFQAERSELAMAYTL